MKTKARSPENTGTSISIERALLEEIDARASSLGMSRSGYLAALARVDLAHGGDFTIPAPTPSHAPSAPAAAQNNLAKLKQDLHAQPSSPRKNVTKP